MCGTWPVRYFCDVVKVLLYEPVKLFRVIRTAVVSCPGVTNGELVKLEHVHDPDLSHRTPEQLGPLVHTCR